MTNVQDCEKCVNTFDDRYRHGWLLEIEQPRWHDRAWNVRAPT